MGTCNGVLCLVTPDSAGGDIPESIHILNPIIGEHQQLPVFEITCPEFRVEQYGFGFDNCKNVFKLVVYLSHIKIKNKNEMQILTIGLVSDNRWRTKVDNLPNVLFERMYDFQSCVDGFLHLIGTNPEDSYRTIVLSFHCGSEDFEVIQIPELDEHKIVRIFTLGVIDNCLSFVDAADDGSVEIWLRKIENGIFSWIKTFSIHRELDPFLGPYILEFLKYSKDGELLLQRNDYLLSYNVKSNTSTDFHIHVNTIAIPFVGSLISVKSQA